MALKGYQEIWIDEEDSSGEQMVSLEFSWEVVGSLPVSNASKVRCTLAIDLAGGGNIAPYRYNSSDLPRGTIHVADQTFTFAFTSSSQLVGDADDRSRMTLWQQDVIISHDSTGTQTFYWDYEADFWMVHRDRGTLEGGNDSGSGTLDAVYKLPSITSASNFTDEENPSITYRLPNIGDGAKVYYTVTKLEACISVTGAKDDVPYRAITIPIDGGSSSYTFNLTASERDALRVASVNAASSSVRFYLRATITGETDRGFTYVSRVLTIVSCNPIINNPTVVDIHPNILALTGDENTLVKYASMIEYSFEPVAMKYATIVSQSIQNGNKKITGLNQGVISDVESGLFVFSVTDSRGLTASTSIEKPIVEYVKPTCYQSFKVELTGETGAKIHLTANGNYFNGTFGAVSNTLKFEVRFTNDEGVMSEWTELAVSPTFNGNTYEIDVTFNGFDYSQSYIFQSRVIDKLYTVESAQYTVRMQPVFDWGKEDFNFNVPVNINANNLNMHGETVLRHNASANNTVLSASGGHIYLRPGGTDDTYSETIFYPDGRVNFSGEVTVNGEKVGGGADYIVECGSEAMGTNGTWYWEKWESGKAVCYGLRNYGKLTLNANEVGTYWTTVTQDYPSGLFNAVPIVTDICIHRSGSYVASTLNTYINAISSSAFTIAFESKSKFSPANSYVYSYMIGRWK